MQGILFFLMLALPAYLMGSIPFGLILVRIFAKQDIRQIGSGNIGATNVMRLESKKLAIATLIMDALKAGLVPFYFVQLTHPGPALGRGMVISFACIWSFVAILGHIFPIWLKFKGGKGVAPYIGALIGISPWAALAFAITWLAVFLRTRISSLAALIALCAVVPIAYAIEYAHPVSLPGVDYGYEEDSKAVTLFCMLSAILLFYTHRANIARLRAGTEPRFAAKA